MCIFFGSPKSSQIEGNKWARSTELIQWYALLEDKEFLRVQTFVREFFCNYFCLNYRRGTDVWDGRTDLFLLTVKTSVISTA